MAIPNMQIEGSDEASSSAEPCHLIIGRVTRPHGVRGDVRVEIRTDEPERFGWLEEVFIGPDDDHLELVAVEAVRWHQGIVIVKLAGYETRNQAEALRNYLLQVPITDALPLQDDEYYFYQLIGLQVETVDGEVLGELAEVLETGANDVFVVRGPAGELLLPDIPEVIREVNPTEGRIVVQLLEGLRNG